MVSLGTENLAICIKLEDKETIEMQFPLLKRLTIITRQHETRQEDDATVVPLVLRTDTGWLWSVISEE